MKMLHKDGETVIAAVSEQDIERMEMSEKYKRILEEILSLIKGLVETKPVVKPEKISVTRGKRGPYKKREPSTASRAAAPRETSSHGPTVIDRAIEIMRRMQRPCLISDVAKALKNSGYVFKAADPIKALGVSFSSDDRITLVRRENRQGLYDIVGEEVSSSTEIDKQKRLQMIKEAHLKTM